jgi:endonuclease YncB( thermonuclease family)
MSNWAQNILRTAPPTPPIGKVYSASVIRVIDGDTLLLSIDLGFSTLTHAKVRLYGINAPESRSRDPLEKELGLKAKAFLHMLLHEKLVTIQCLGLGSFGRWLVFVWLGDLFVNGHMIRSRFAKPLTTR